MKALITRKVGMTSTIAEDGVVQAITLLSVNPNVVTQIKTDDKDGYTAVQFGTEKTKKLGKSGKGHFKQSKIAPKLVHEFRTEELDDEIKLGADFSVDVFEPGDIVHATGLNKGKGWAGTIKRHNFHRGRKTHGGRSYRRPGSIGSMYPQHIFKGTKMAGQMGATQVTIRNLKVALVDNELGVLGIYGAIPGPKKSVILVKGAK